MEIRPMTQADASVVLEMMRTFYASPAVHTNGSEEIFRADVAACVGENPCAEGFLLTENGAPVGYAMLAKSFSTEYGRPCVWIEDLYLLPAFRGRGYGGQVLSFVEERYPDALLRLEAEPENLPAVKAYRKSGFTELPYLELKKEPKNGRSQ